MEIQNHKNLNAQGRPRLCRKCLDFRNLQQTRITRVFENPQHAGKMKQVSDGSSEWTKFGKSTSCVCCGTETIPSTFSSGDVLSNSGENEGLCHVRHGTKIHFEQIWPRRTKCVCDDSFWPDKCAVCADALQGAQEAIANVKLDSARKPRAALASTPICANGRDSAMFVSPTVLGVERVNQYTGNQ